MPIKKQEFYEGAALHLLARTNEITNLRYDAPFFVLNGRLLIHLKYSTKGRSPWPFTFTPEEQALLGKHGSVCPLVMGLICGADGVAALDYEHFTEIALTRASAVRITCSRRHGERYELKGPDGTLSRKVAPSSWQRILER